MPNKISNLNSLDACNPALNATVSASAGSGKTWLLITRIVRLLINGAEPGNIIALTFTRKAAGEMQIRLTQRLFKMAIAEDDELEKILELIGCDVNKETTIVARNLYEKLMHHHYPVRIQTFHSFCQDILSRFPLEADIPPGFELLEDSSILERQAWQALFMLAAKQLENKSNTLSDALDTIMHACNGPDNTYTALHSFLSHRSDWWAYTAHTTKPTDFAATELKQSLQLEDESCDPVTLFFTNDNKEKIKIFSNLLREIKNKTSEKHATVIEQALSQCGHDDIDINNHFIQIKSAFIKKDGAPLIQGRQHNAALDKKLGEENANHFIELHDELASAILQIDEQLKRIVTLKINKAWYLAGHQYVEIYQQLKRDMRLLDFTDLEWKCYQLLQHADNAHWVQYKIDQRIDHLLIDEFQDTNPTQWNLLSPILEEIAANPEERSRSVFLVGDEKQSIYSFRRANPALQIQASEWLKTNLNAKTTPLDFSRRSSSAIIHCVNKIFEQDEIQNIITGFTTHDTHLSSLPGQVHLYDLFKNNDEDTNEIEEDNLDAIYFRNPLKQPRVTSSKTLRHKEAENIAKQIINLKNSNELITGNTGIRPIEFDDILILMRNRTHVNIYEETFKKYDIPFISSKKGGLLDNLEIQDLSCLLNTLITPYNNLALAQVLRSPIFNATDDDLIQLAQHESKHWYEGLLELATTNQETTSEKTSLLKPPLQRAAKLLPHWKKLAEKLPIHDCLDKIFSEGNIINRYKAANKLENKQKVAANCQKFLELSLEVDSGRYPSITNFLQRLKQLSQHSTSPPEEPLPHSDRSRVSIMTIHGSKGLEAPIVFLADCNSSSTNKNAYTSMVRWPAKNAQPKSFQLQLSKDKTDEITQKSQQIILNEQAREELNLLYVALTRAREQLHISGIESSKKQKNSWYKIISNALLNITTQEIDTENTNRRTYRHLTYDYNNQIAAKENNALAKTNFLIDERLLKPFKNFPALAFIIAPSSQIHESRQQNNLETKFSHLETKSISSHDLAQWQGIMIHRTIELLSESKDYPATQEKIDAIKQSLSTDNSLKNPAFLQHLDDCMNEAVSVYNHHTLKKIFSPEKNSKTYNEMPIMYKKNGEAVYGIIDRVITSDDKIMIIDYKSHKLDKGESINATAKLFTKQLTLYRDGIKKIWPKHTIKMGILFTHYKEMIWLK